MSGDYAADAIAHLVLSERPPKHQTHHLVTGPDAPTASTLTRIAADVFKRTPIALNARAPQVPIGALAPYLAVTARFDDTDTQTSGTTGITRANPAHVLRAALAYARLAAWGRRPVVRENAPSHHGQDITV